MIKHIQFDSLFLAEHGWLTSRFHFSFAEYQNPKNMHYGVLRVMNDDRVQAQTGFGTHPHQDMEIVTYIITGELTHKDSMGNRESLGRGACQYMSAGTGITHSEMNDGSEEVHFIQTWILPEANGLTPRYGSKIFATEERHNRWLHIAGPEKSDAAIQLYQDANMFTAEIDGGKSLAFTLDPDRQLYVKIMEGNGDINRIGFDSGDAAEVESEDLNVQARTDMHLLLIEMSNTTHTRGEGL